MIWQKNGTSEIIYKKRLEILRNIFKDEVGITDVTLIDAKYNVMYIVTSLLMDIPSATQINTCQDNICAITRENKSATIILRLSNGYKNLQLDLEVYTKGHILKCANCKSGLIQCTRVLHEHLFIETDFHEELVFLTDFPSQISIEDKW